MKSPVTLLVAWLAFAMPVLAQPGAIARLETSPRHHEWAQVKQGDRTVKTFVAFPEIKSKALAVIVIHENRGLTDFERSVADRLAGEGYIALAPDLLSGTAPGGGGTSDHPSSDAARQAIYQLDAQTVVADLHSVAEYAKGIPAADGRLAVIGFCWGGGQTWRFAMARPDLVLAAPFYGTAPAGDAASFESIRCHVHGFYGGNDARVNATIEPTAAAMKAAGKTYESVIYEGARHAYMRAGQEEDADAANKTAMEQSWKRLLALLAAAGK